MNDGFRRTELIAATPVMMALLFGASAADAKLPLGAIGTPNNKNVPPNTSGPRNFEGVWYPEGGSGPPGGGGGPPGGGPPNAGVPGGPPGGGASAPPGGGPSGGETITDSRTQCAPKFRTEGGGGGSMVLIVQSTKQMVLSGEENTGTFQNIYIGGTHPLADKLVPQPNGHAIARWDGDTLVVDGIGYSDSDGRDSGKHLIERFNKKDGKLNIEITMITKDGKSSTTRTSWSWRPDLQYNESICEEGFARYQLSGGELTNPNVPPRKE